MNKSLFIFKITQPHNWGS